MVIKSVRSIDLYLPYKFYNANAQETQISFGIEFRLILSDLFKYNNQIKLLQDKVEAAKLELEQARGQYYPSMNFSEDNTVCHTQHISRGNEEEDSPISIKAKQLITDFGKTNRSIDYAQKRFKKAQLELKSMKQKIMLEGIKLYLRLISERDKLSFAKYIEKKIVNINNIEKILVENRIAPPKDISYIKILNSQLKESFETAVNDFHKIFSVYPTELYIKRLKPLIFPQDKIPLTMNESINIALKNNPQLHIAALEIDIATSKINIMKSRCFPRLDVFARTDGLFEEEEEGWYRYKRNYTIGIEFNYNLTKGDIDIQSLKAVRSSKIFNATHYKHTKNQIKEKVSSSWDNLIRLQKEENLLNKQTDTSSNLLTIVNKEMKMNHLYLLDIVKSELNHINTLIKTIEAKKNSTIAAYTLLYSMGMLSEQLFTQK